MPEAPTPLHEALLRIAHRQPLSESLAAQVFGVVMRGEATPSQIGALLLGLRAKGETPDEVAGVARALREAMIKVVAPPGDNHLIDTCGTGGGAVSTFNISTVAAFVAAGAGATVAKHGNRSFTSRCGSADVLEALGVAVTLDTAAAARALREARMAFLFAPSFHPAMRHVGAVRRELGTPSVMNLVGPLANPAGVLRQVIGVADAERAGLVAGALTRLGTEHAWVVHGRVGMDEISPAGTTEVWEIRAGRVASWELDPKRYGLAHADAAALRGGEPAENAARAQGILAGGGGDPAGRAAVLLNAGAAIYVAGLADSFDAGLERAREALSSGAAGEVLERLRRVGASTSG